MANEVPELFDPVKARLALARAEQRGAETFLLEHIAEELDERLQAVLRDFPVALEIGSPSPMIAARLQREGRRVERRADEAELAATEAAASGACFDLIASVGLFHRVNDLPGLMLRLRRLLKPDGLMIAAFPGGDSLMELRASLLQAESEVTGNAAMRSDLPGSSMGSARRQARRAARCPAPSPSKHRIGSSTCRQASSSCASVSAVPSGATSSPMPAPATPMTSI
jgi:SAM-dependent methyltransferase